MAAFTNPQIQVDDLPHYEELTFIPLEKDYLTVLNWGGIIFMAINLAVPIALISWLGYWDDTFYLLIFFGGWIMLNVLNLILMRMRFEKMGYAIRDRDIIYKKGLIVRQTTTVPFNRVQHCDIKQGLVERYVGLSRINVYTAGGGTSDLSIPGLKPPVAQRIMDFILQKANIYEEEE